MYFKISAIMKKIKYPLFIIFSFLFVVSVQAQDVKSKQTSTCRFNFTSEQDMFAFLQLSGEAGLALAFQLNNAEAKEFMDETYALVEKKLRDAGVKLNDINSLEGTKVNYSKMGFPIVGLKKASKSNKAEQYMTLEVSLIGTRKIVSTTTINGASRAVTKCYPEVKVTVAFGGTDGKKIKKIKGVHRLEEKLSITSLSFDLGGGLSISTTEEVAKEDLPFYQMLDKALDDLIKQL